MDASRHGQGPSRLPSGLSITGELTSDDDIVIEGIFEGQITLPESDLTIADSARVNARILARNVVVAGRLDGSIVASVRVRLGETAVVTGHLQTPSVAMHDGAHFTGSVDPDRSAAAVHVARYRQKQSQAG